MVYAQVLADEDANSACAFLRAAVAYNAGLGITICEILPDNGGCYPSGDFAQTCGARVLKHRFTRPYTPRTNGKAERFIQTDLREWAYARVSPFPSTHQRAAALAAQQQSASPHASLAGQPPASRLGLTRNNLMRIYN